MDDQECLDAQRWRWHSTHLFNKATSTGVAERLMKRCKKKCHENAWWKRATCHARNENSDCTNVAQQQIVSKRAYCRLCLAGRSRWPWPRTRPSWTTPTLQLFTLFMLSALVISTLVKQKLSAGHLLFLWLLVCNVFHRKICIINKYIHASI